MKLFAIYITNNATTYGGAQSLRRVVLFVWLGNPIVYKGNTFTWEQGRKLVSGINCIPESAYHEFMNTKMRYGKTDGRMFYHLFQSFHPDEQLTPETAHAMGVAAKKERLSTTMKHLNAILFSLKRFSIK